MRLSRRGFLRTITIPLAMAMSVPLAKALLGKKGRILAASGKLSAELGYVPSPFQLSETEGGRRDGLSGDEAISLIFHRPEIGLHNMPMLVFVAADSQQLTGHSSRTAESFRDSRGRNLKYYDGMWVLSDPAKPSHVHWSNEEVHTLLLEGSGWTAAVRGARTAGIGREEMQKILDELTVQVL